MTVGQVPYEKLSTTLSNPGLRVKIGPFNTRIQTKSLTLANQLYNLYEDYNLADDEIAEFHVSMETVRPIKKRFLPYVRFQIDR